MRRSVGGSPRFFDPTIRTPAHQLIVWPATQPFREKTMLQFLHCERCRRIATGSGARYRRKDVSFRGLQKDAPFEELVSETRQHNAGPLETK